MTQVTKIIDVSKSFVVIDPNSMAENLSYTTKEDSPEDAAPIVAYEGYNFLPTSYGYKSFFGENSTLDTLPLTSNVDHAFIFQMANFQNALIALCDDGIWYNTGHGWVQGVTLSVPTVGSHLEWTYTIIENILYMYRQGGSLVYKLGYSDFTLTPIIEGLSVGYIAPMVVPNSTVITGSGSSVSPVVFEFNNTDGMTSRIYRNTKQFGSYQLIINIQVLTGTLEGHVVRINSTNLTTDALGQITYSIARSSTGRATFLELSILTGIGTPYTASATITAHELSVPTNDIIIYDNNNLPLATRLVSALITGSGLTEDPYIMNMVGAIDVAYMDLLVGSSAGILHITAPANTLITVDMALAGTSVNYTTGVLALALAVAARERITITYDATNNTTYNVWATVT